MCWSSIGIGWSIISWHFVVEPLWICLQILLMFVVFKITWFYEINLDDHFLSFIFRHALPCPWLVFVHIWCFAPHSLPLTSLQVQVEAQTSANAAVRIAKHYLYNWLSICPGNPIGRRMLSIFASSHYVLQARIRQHYTIYSYGNRRIQYQSINPLKIYQSSAHHLPICSQVGDLAKACWHQVRFSHP